MEQTTENIKTFTGYEYKEIAAPADKYSFLIDGYECFGWKIDDNLPGAKDGELYAKRIAGGKTVTLRMTRDRKIVNKVELTRLQRNFEACINEVEELERSKTSGASMWALTVGIIGTVFMAGSVFAVVAAPPQIMLCIILAVPAFMGWIAPYFIYKHMVAARTKKVIPMVEAKYDEMYELCEKGSKLLY